MYRFICFLCTFVLCINCILSAPPSLLSALLSPPAAVPASHSSSPSSSSSSSAATASAPAPAPVADRRETGLTTYDQKQSGKYNIHLNIKDVAIIALDAGGVDSGLGDLGGDYYDDYDLSDFTVKPIFGLIEVASNKPSTASSASGSSEPPPLIHFEPDSWNVTSSNETENASSSLIEEPIIKDPAKEPVNKTQSVSIFSPGTSNNVSLSSTAASASKPTTQPPKLTLADLANIQSAEKPSPLPVLFPTKPNEIPVQIVLDSSSRQRPHGNWQLRNRIRATPSQYRRITPPHFDQDNSQPQQQQPQHHIGNTKYRKHTNLRRRNCIVDQNGQCQNSQRRFSSPTLNGIMSLLSFLSPREMEKLE